MGLRSILTVFPSWNFSTCCWKCRFWFFANTSILWTCWRYTLRWAVNVWPLQPGFGKLGCPYKWPKIYKWVFPGVCLHPYNQWSYKRSLNSTCPHEKPFFFLGDKKITKPPRPFWNSLPKKCTQKFRFKNFCSTPYINITKSNLGWHCPGVWFILQIGGHVSQPLKTMGSTFLPQKSFVQNLPS